MTEDCAQSCECTKTGAVCQAKGCREDEICTVFETKLDCYKGELIKINTLNTHYYFSFFKEFIELWKILLILARIMY